MTSMRAIRFLLLSAAAATLPGARALASARPALAPLGAEVRAGEIVELSWPDLPGEVQELEIQLSIDGGRHYAVRVSPELDPRERRFRWRVPNLPTDCARLRVRLGTERAEIAGEPTPAFRIRGTLEAGGSATVFREGAVWTGPGGWSGCRAGALASSAAGLETRDAAYEPATAPRAPIADPAQLARRDEVGTPEAPALPRHPGESARPRFTPLRN